MTRHSRRPGFAAGVAFLLVLGPVGCGGSGQPSQKVEQAPTDKPEPNPKGDSLPKPAPSRPAANLPEKEIARLREDLKAIDRETITAINELARQRVTVNDLQTQTDELAAKQGKEKELLAARAEAVKNATTDKVTFGNRTLSVADAKAELETGAKRYAANQKSLASAQALLANRIKVRDVLEKQLETLKTLKSQLAGAIDGAETDLLALKLQGGDKAPSEFRLEKIKEDLRKLKTKIDVEREKLKLTADVLPEPKPGKSVDGTLAPAPPKP